MPLDPLLAIWIRPRDTVQALIAENSQSMAWLLASLNGVSQSLSSAASIKAPPHTSSNTVLLGACAFGLVIGPVSLWVTSWIFHRTGRWLGGHATAAHIRIALAWAQVPAAASLLLWVPRFLVFGPDILLGEPPGLSGQPGKFLTYGVLGLTDFLLGLWGFVLVCNALAEVQGFRSAWRALANILLGVLVVFIPLFFIFFLSVVFTHR